jgi:hypothetical protein
MYFISLLPRSGISQCQRNDLPAGESDRSFPLRRTIRRLILDAEFYFLAPPRARGVAISRARELIIVAILLVYFLKATAIGYKKGQMTITNGQSRQLDARNSEGAR